MERRRSLSRGEEVSQKHSMSLLELLPSALAATFSLKWMQPIHYVSIYLFVKLYMGMSRPMSPLVSLLPISVGIIHCSWYHIKMLHSRFSILLDVALGLAMQLQHPFGRAVRPILLVGRNHCASFWRQSLQQLWNYFTLLFIFLLYSSRWCKWLLFCPQRIKIKICILYLKVLESMHAGITIWRSQHRPSAPGTLSWWAWNSVKETDRNARNVRYDSCKDRAVDHRGRYDMHDNAVNPDERWWTLWLCRQCGL